MIIGITGRAGSGKSTLARYLEANLRGPGWQPSGAALQYEGNPAPTYKRDVRIMAFADALRDVVQAVFGSRYETQESKATTDLWWEERIHWGVHPTKQMPILGDANVTGRRILQFVGTEIFRNMVHPDIWLYAMERRLPPEPCHVIIPDVRFENEAAWVRDHGGCILHVIRPFLQSTDAHASEKPLPSHSGDRTIVNGDSLIYLEAFAGVVVRELGL